MIWSNQWLIILPLIYWLIWTSYDNWLYNFDNTEITTTVIEEKIKNMQKNLTVNKKVTSRYVRTLTSSPDKRRSAQNVGFVGVSIIATVVGVVVLSDCVNVIIALQNKHRGAKVDCSWLNCIVLSLCLFIHYLRFRFVSM